MLRLELRTHVSGYLCAAGTQHAVIYNELRDVSRMQVDSLCHNAEAEVWAQAGADVDAGALEYAAEQVKA